MELKDIFALAETKHKPAHKSKHPHKKGDMVKNAGTSSVGMILSPFYRGYWPIAVLGGGHEHWSDHDCHPHTPGPADVPAAANPPPAPAAPADMPAPNAVDAQSSDPVAEGRQMKNHMDETEYSSWDSWRKACRKAHEGVTFQGDKDIAQAMHSDGKHAIGEWDGAVGIIYKKPAGMTEDLEAEAKKSGNIWIVSFTHCPGKTDTRDFTIRAVAAITSAQAVATAKAKLPKDVQSCAKVASVKMTDEKVKEGFGIKIDGKLMMNGDKPMSFASSEEATAAILKSSSMSPKNAKVVPLQENDAMQALGKGLKGSVGTKSTVANDEADAEVKTDVNTPPADKEDSSEQTSEFKVGDKVTPTVGPHKGVVHSVIHVFPDGRINLKPDGLKTDQIQYRLGAVTANPDQVTLAESFRINRNILMKGGSLLAIFGKLDEVNKDGFMPIGYGPKKGHKIEAYGRKGMKNTMWRKMFKSTAELNKWCEDNDATVEGSRDLDDNEKV